MAQHAGLPGQDRRQPQAGDGGLSQADTHPAASRAAARATFLVFLIAGLATAAWAPLVPDAKLRLGLDDDALGVLLLAFGGGAVLAMPLAGWLAQRLGGRRVMLGLGLVMAASIPLLAVAPDPVSLALALGVFGAGLGSVDVSVNAQAVVVEAAHGRPMMSGFHGGYSLGGLVGAAAMSALRYAGLPALGCALVAAAFCAGVLVWQAPGLLARADRQAASRAGLFWPGWRLALIASLCAVSFLIEGVILDWSAVLLRFSRGADAATAGLGYATFSLAMVAGRLTGDRVVRACRPVPVMLWGSLLAALGFMAMAALPSVAAGLLGCAMVGLGAANIVPVLFSFAGRIPGVPPAVAMSVVVTPGYGGLLVGPVLVGFIAAHTGLPLAIASIGVLTLSLTLLGGLAAGPTERRT